MVGPEDPCRRDWVYPEGTQFGGQCPHSAFFGSLKREGVPELRLAGPGGISWVTARSNMEPHAHEYLK